MDLYWECTGINELRANVVEGVGNVGCCLEF